MAASRKIRELIIDFGGPHQLQAEGYSLTIWPLETKNGVSRVPFTFSPDEGDAVDGRLCISRPGELLQLQISKDVTGEQLRIAWLNALINLASYLKRRRQSATAGPATAQPASTNLTSGRAARVNGHIRNLGPYKRHGEDKQHQAARHGIRLGEHETWVSAHDRGAPARGLVRIPWTAPAELDELVADQTQVAS
jgi:hypothetical protein